ncbi:MAG: dTDP-glucose 4,6-dehydratase [Candidatus Micrarchaeota archaeon]|nr:dTDP-glucose 4,6-dehydratase [Candidatus Micrarchaeota archaeon]
MDTILVTGGAGFIFSNFIHYMLNNYPEYKIVNLDKLTYAANLSNLHGLEKNDNYKFYKGDICNKKLVEKLIKEEKIDTIINGAAESHVDRSIFDAGSFVKTDVLGVYNLLEAAKKFNIEKFIQISTDEVYSEIEIGSFKETDKLTPKNPYAASKAGGDLLALSYVKTYGLPVMITRSTNNYGYYHHPEKFIPKAIVYGILNKKIPVYGNGKAVRDWLFVKDNCEAIDTILHKGKIGEIYNIAGKQEMENIAVVKMILDKLGKSNGLIEFVKDRPGHDLRYSLDIDKLRGLGWKPKTTFEDGIDQTISWYQQNSEWWKPIMKNQIDFHKKF